LSLGARRCHCPSAAHAIAGLFERIARPELAALDRSWSSFRVLGCVGAALGTAVGALLVLRLGLSLSVLTGMSALALGVTVGLYRLTWRVARTRRLVYYRYQIAILVTLAAFLWMLRQPVIAYLDVAVLGIGTFLVAGRLGCFMVGCCHGIPHELGVSYGTSHVRYGFPPHFAHVRLIPIQVIESAWVFASVVAGAVVMLGRGGDPGRAISTWIALYGFGRFHFEFLRGDPERPYFGGFSEAQWTSLALMLASIVAGVGGVLPIRPWHVVLALIVGFEMSAFAVARAIRATGAHLLSHPRHVDQLAQILGDLGSARAEKTPGTLVGRTALGINLSMARAEGRDEQARPVFTLSRVGSALSERDARTLARWLGRLCNASGDPSLRFRESGVVHVAFPSQRTVTQVRPLPRQRRHAADADDADDEVAQPTAPAVAKPRGAGHST
jgi:hypothetical protein